MNSRLIAIALLMVVGIAILALLITPAVHVPYIVVHGPMSALRVQRATALFNAIIGAGAFLFVRRLLPSRNSSFNPEQGFAPLNVGSPAHLSCTLRC